jgi:hypothetical protein
MSTSGDLRGRHRCYGIVRRRSVFGVRARHLRPTKDCCDVQLDLLCIRQPRFSSRQLR